MKVRVAVVLLLGACAVRAEDTPAYARLKRIAAEMAEFGMPVDMTKVRLTIREPTIADLQSRAGAERIWHDLKDVDSESGLKNIAGGYHVAEGRIGLLALGMAWWTSGDGIAAHELAHACQHQSRGETFDRSQLTTDQGLVRWCMIEGEAELAALSLQLARRGGKLGDVDFRTVELVWRAGMKPSRIFAAYFAGFRFMGVQAQRHGVGKLAELHLNPPETTEQLLHPAKLGRDRPTPIRFPRLPKAKVVQDDSFGELHTRVLFEAKLRPVQAIRASIGWDGDLIRFFETAAGKKYWVWITVWDREIDARQAEWAMRRVYRRSVTLRSGRTVTVLGAADDALRAQLVNALREWDCSGKLDEVGAVTATAVEEEAVKLAAQAHRLRDGRWVIPEIGVSIPVPDGWKLATGRKGTHLTKTVKGHRYKLHADVWPMAAFGDLKGMADHLRRSPHALYWLRPIETKVIDGAGHGAVLSVREVMRGLRGTGNDLIEVRVPRGASVVRFAMMSPRGGPWSVERYEVKKALREFRVEPR